MELYIPGLSQVLFLPESGMLSMLHQMDEITLIFA